MEARLTDDTFASERTPHAKLGARPVLLVGSRPVAKSYLKFDLSALPAGATGHDVATATLRLWVRRVTGAGTISVSRVMSAWREESLTMEATPSLGSLESAGTMVAPTDFNSFINVD